MVHDWRNGKGDRKKYRANYDQTFRNAQKLFYCPKCGESGYTSLIVCPNCGNGMVELSPVTVHLEPGVNMEKIIEAIKEL